MAKERDREDVIERREGFLSHQKTLDARQLIFLDKSGFKLGSPPRYGWAPKGKKAPGYVVHNSWKSMTIIGALALDGFRGLMTVDAAMDGDVYSAFVDHQLAPNIKPGDVVVMDNLSVHKNTRALAAIERAGGKVLFLPPYSPEFNPIEKAWAKIKEMIRRRNTLTRDAFDEALATAVDAITQGDIKAWTLFAGYTFTSTSCRLAPSPTLCSASKMHRVPASCPPRQLRRPVRSALPGCATMGRTGGDVVGADSRT